jgi:hypothetical protein
MSELNVEVVRSLLEPFQSINTAEVDWGADADLRVRRRSGSRLVSMW